MSLKEPPFGPGDWSGPRRQTKRQKAEFGGDATRRDPQTRESPGQRGGDRGRDRGSGRRKKKVLLRQGHRGSCRSTGRRRYLSPPVSRTSLEDTIDGRGASRNLLPLKFQNDTTLASLWGHKWSIRDPSLGSRGEQSTNWDLYSK